MSKGREPSPDVGAAVALGAGYVGAAAIEAAA